MEEGTEGIIATGSGNFFGLRVYGVASYGVRHRLEFEAWATENTLYLSAHSIDWHRY